jgi:radical SAM superfamily enzyme YgiQ (UPF0313 family)
MIPTPSAPSTTRAADVVLVKTSPEVIVQGAWYRMPLLGLGYLAGYLRARGVKAGIVDAMFDRLSLEETVRRVVDAAPRLVGLTAMTHEIRRAAEVARAIRRRLPGARFVIGGPHCTALPERTLEEFEVFDFGVFGEGEETLLELWSALVRGEGESAGVLERISGLVWRRDGQAARNKARPWIRDLDALPQPAWDLYGPSEVYQIFASRGCPFQCIFCMRVLGDEVRFRSPRSVVDEFEAVVERYHPRQIDFSDETFTLRRGWTLEICDELIRRGLHRCVRWFANGRVNTVDEELLRRMREAGCVRIGFGIESGNEEILRAAHKGTTTAQVEKAVAACKRVGLEMEAFYILGFPGETRRTALDTIGLAARLNTTTAAFGIMVPYPGTRVAEMAERGEGGYRLLSRDWSAYDKHLGDALELATLSRRELERLQARAYLWFYLRNLRVADLFRFFWEKRKAIGKMARKQLGGLHL